MTPKLANPLIRNFPDWQFLLLPENRLGRVRKHVLRHAEADYSSLIRHLADFAVPAGLLHFMWTPTNL